MFVRKLALTGAMSVILAGASVTAASASPPPGGGQWTLTAVSSTGGASAYVEVNSSGLITDGMLCDSKADSHHAYGAIQYSDDGGATWLTASEESEYGGNGACVDWGFSLFRGYSMLRAKAETLEGSTEIGKTGYSAVWRIS